MNKRTLHFDGCAVRSLLQTMTLFEKISMLNYFQTRVNEIPDDLPEVVNDFDIEEEEIAIENRSGLLTENTIVLLKILKLDFVVKRAIVKTFETLIRLMNVMPSLV